MVEATLHVETYFFPYAKYLEKADRCLVIVSSQHVGGASIEAINTTSSV